MNAITRRRFLAATGICAGALPMLEQWLAAATVSGTPDTYTPPLNGPVDRVVSLAGNWALQLDAEDAGLEQQWFLRSLSDRIQLPGSLDERGKGSLNEKRETGMLSRVRTHTGPAWFQREIEIPAGWASLRVIFAIERSKATRVWLDDRLVGSADSHSVEQCFDLGSQGRRWPASRVQRLATRTTRPPRVPPTPPQPAALRRIGSASELPFHAITTPIKKQPMKIKTWPRPGGAIPEAVILATHCMKRQTFCRRERSQQ
jgi:hypothetical protein